MGLASRLTLSCWWVGLGGCKVGVVCPFGQPHGPVPCPAISPGQLQVGEQWGGKQSHFLWKGHHSMAATPGAECWEAPLTPPDAVVYIGGGRGDPLLTWQSRRVASYVPAWPGSTCASGGLAGGNEPKAAMTCPSQQGRLQDT